MSKEICRGFRKTLVRTGPELDDFTIVDSAKAQKKAYRKNATFLKLHPVG